MAVYYKFKSAKDYDSVAIDGHFMSVANLKERIYESKHLGSGTDFDLMVTNAQTNEEYLDEAMLIPKNTSVLIRRVPGRPRMNIVAEQDDCRSRVSENKAEDAQPAKSSYPVPEPFLTRLPEDSEWDEFGSDLYSIPEVLPVLPSNAVQDAPPHNKADEDSKIKALIDTSALDWQRQTQDGFGSGRGFGRGMVGRMMGGRGLGRGGFERKTPPMGYICHRCKVPGHFIQHCPTNGDPNYDVKRVKPPTGIPKSMLMATPDGSYALPSGAVAVLKPNEAAFEKEMEGLPTTQSLCDLPPELRCPLCVDVMKDAVLTSKCCLKSFCDKCIRNHILSKSTCICGATNILVDYLLPNKTLRDTINRVLGSNYNNVENAGNVSQIQDMESARPKVSSPALSATSKGDSVPPAARNVTSDLKDPMTEYKATVSAPQPLVMKGRSEKNMGIPEAARESVSMKETTSQGSAPLPADEVQQKLQAVDPGKKKKKKKACLPLNAADMQWRTSQDFAPENYMMPPCPSAYNPYWAGMQLGMDGYPPYSGAMPYMGYAPSPFDVPFGGFVPQDPFVGGQGFMLPAVPPQRNLSEFVMGANPVRPIMSREQFEARKADLRKKQEMERHVESREYSRGRGGGREAGSSCDVSSMKSKPMSMPRVASAADRPHHHPNQRMEKPLSPVRLGRDSDSTRFGKKKSEPYRYPDDDYYPNNHRHQSDNGPRASAAVAAEKSSVFSRISFADGGSKRKLTSSIGASKEVMANGDKDYEPSSASPRNRSSSSFEWKSPAVASLGTGGPRRSVADYDSSDDERHFKRRPSRYEPLPPPVEREDEARPSRSSRSRQQEQDGDERGRGRSNKHR